MTHYSYGRVMFEFFSRSLAKSRHRQGKPDAVEYGVLFTLAAVGVGVVCLTSRSTSTPDPRAEEVTIEICKKLLQPQTSDPHTVRGTDSGPVARTDDSVKSFEKKKGNSAAASAESGGSDAAGMSEEDARLAILGLLTVYPHMFATTAETVETAAIVHQKDCISLASFRCHLKSRRFAYHPPATSKNGASVYGVFYQKANGAWAGRITNTVR
jgi:hypothetical protein